MEDQQEQAVNPQAQTGSSWNELKLCQLSPPLTLRAGYFAEAVSVLCHGANGTSGPGVGGSGEGGAFAGWAAAASS